MSNSFDAGAENVHVILSPNLMDQNATIVVIDDGQGMNVDSLKEHWIIGQSSRRMKPNFHGRKPIGKFGIGKLATYVLAGELTHICKSSGKYYATTMDYTSALPSQQDDIEGLDYGGIYDDKSITLPIRELSEEEAMQVLEPWLSGSREGYRALLLFGNSAVPSWTVAIMSRLKSIGRKIERGRLKWILRTAMPICDDFKLFLDGNPIEPAKIDVPLIDKWVIGKDIVEDTLRNPCPEEFTVTEDTSFNTDSIHRWGLSHPVLGRITGYIELYSSDISGGKSAGWGRSNGFFVYVRDRMINTAAEDDGFGIPRNLLRHGTFAQFRMIVYIDGLDKVLRSSRESLLEGQLYELAQDFLHAAFNYVRNRLVDYEKSQSPASLFAARIASTPGSLTRTPLLSLAMLTIEGKTRPIYTRLPPELTAVKRREILATIQERLLSNEDIVQTTEFIDLDTTDVIAVYDVMKSKLLINTSHPFVASFQDLYSKPSSGMPLEMYAMAEILTEANLYHMGVEENKISDILTRRDEMLRYFVRSAKRRTPGMIALALTDAKDNDNRLEEEMRAAFEAIGFDNVIRIGGNGKPDGTAEAYLSPAADGSVQSYKVGLEAKSGNKVSAHRLGVSGISRHMKEFQCHHHVVIGNGFETTNGDDSATVKEIKEIRQRTGKTIVLMLIDDLARLVRLVPAKRIGLQRLRELFSTCITPEQTKVWIDHIEQEVPLKLPYREILDTIWDRAHKRSDEAVDYGAVMVALEYRDPPIHISSAELIELCKVMQVMAPGIVFARPNTVEIGRRPDLVLKDIQEAIGEYPEKEQRTISL